jgi:hypothetical protein
MNLLDAFIGENAAVRAIPRNEIWIAIRTDAVVGTGTRNDNGSTVAMFDSVLKYALPNTTIRLGPGVYRTNGGNVEGSNFPGVDWGPKAGQRLIGAGQFATTLRFVWNFDLLVPNNQTLLHRYFA